VNGIGKKTRNPFNHFMRLIVGRLQRDIERERSAQTAG